MRHSLRKPQAGKIKYDKPIENAIKQLSNHIETKNINKEIVALKLLSNDKLFIQNLVSNNELTNESLNALNPEIQKCKDTLTSTYSDSLQEVILSQFTKLSEEISTKCIHKNNKHIINKYILDYLLLIG